MTFTATISVDVFRLLVPESADADRADTFGEEKLAGAVSGALRRGSPLLPAGLAWVTLDSPATTGMGRWGVTWATEGRDGPNASESFIPLKRAASVEEATAGLPGDVRLALAMVQDKAWNLTPKQ